MDIDINEWALDQMRKIDIEHNGDIENWHIQADALVFKCLLLDLNDETKGKIASWFNKGKKWYA